MATPPGREKQVQALKSAPGIDNPWAVAWASYNGDDAGEYLGARCEACEQDVPVADGKYDAHVRGMKLDDYDPDQPREKTGEWGAGGAGGGGVKEGSGGGGAKEGSSGGGKGEEKPWTHSMKSTKPEHVAEHHRAIAEHLKSKGEHALAAKHEEVAAKHEKKAAKERQKANQAQGKKADAAENLMEMCDGSGTECHADSVTLRGGKWIVLGASGKVAGIFGSREEAEAQEQALKEKAEKSDDAVDLVAAWNGYSWEETNTPAWPGKICPTCLNPIPIVDGKVAPHLRDAAAPWKPEEDHMCPGGGQAATADVAKRIGGCWLVVDPDVGKVLSSHQKREEALAAIREVQRAVKKKDGALRVERCDLAQLAPPTLTADGFLQVEGRVARTGVQEYRNADGSTRRELRLPAEVSASVPGFALAPFTNDHPAEGVTPENARETVVGAVGDAQLGGDGWVTAPIRIYAADAIEATKGGRAQLSVGYSCRLDFAPGQWQGQKYDAVQREIVVNHVALVDLARAGTLARLRLDAATADLACDTPAVADSKLQMEKTKMDFELRIDGMTFKTSDPNAQAAVDRIVKKLEESNAAMQARVTNADTLVVTANKDRDTAQAARDNAVTELKTVHGTKISILGITVADALDEAKSAPALRAVVEAAAAARATLLLEARKHLGANERFDAYVDPKTNKEVAAKSDLEIKKLVVEKLDKDVKLDGKSADYVQARYDGLVEAANKSQPKSIDLLRATVNAPPTATNADAAPTDAQSARAAFVQNTLARKFADN